MADINVTRDSKLIKVLASQARNERVDSNIVSEANAIITDLSKDLNPQNRHQIAQTIAFTVDELQKGSLDFLNVIADQKTIGYGDKPAFNVKTEGIKAYIQAKGSTTARSFVSDRQILIDTKEISARPALNIMELRTGRINMADLIREANTEMTNLKLAEVQKVLHAAVANYASPFYSSGTGVVKANLDAQLNYFRRLGPVNILGDVGAVSQLAGLTGMAMSNTQNQFADSQILEHNNNGFIGKYNGANVIVMNNAYETGKTTPILDPDWLYIIPAGVTADARNLKIVNEGSVNAIEAQDINDLVYEIRLDQWFGAAFVVGNLPTIGAYKIN